MAYELIFSERSEEETDAALAYYDQINPDLGNRFLAELIIIYQKLSRSPQYYSFISAKKPSAQRDVKFPSFPYVVIFEIRQEFVYIISVMHSYRAPLIH